MRWMADPMKNFYPNMTWLKLTAFIVHWAARLSAALVLGMVLIIVVPEVVVGGGGPNFFKMSWTVRFMFAAELLTILGLAVIWWWELLGGLNVLGGMLLFSWLNFQAYGTIPGGAFYLFYIPGLLAVISWIIARFAKAANSRHLP